MSARWRPLYPMLVAALVLTVSAPRAATPHGMTLDDVMTLLKAGVGEKVILRQVEATGTRLTLTVGTILKLKTAGASDDLLAALVGPPADVASPSAVDAPDARPATSPFRVYRDKNDRGEEVLHITNLDESGRRIGGETENHAPPNVIQPGSDSPALPERAERYDERPPVIVNVYPPEPAPTESEIAGGYVDHGSFYPVGRYRGYDRHCAFPGRYLGPPGSYSHYLLYHHPAAFDTLPYRVNTAAERNRMRFGRH